MTSYKKFRITLIALLGTAMFCVTSCKEDEKEDGGLKSNACEIVSFTAGNGTWTLSGTDITGTFPSGTDVTNLAPTITASEGATVNPASGVARDFSVAAGVTYWVTAADGETEQIYTAKALTGSSNGLADRTGWTAVARHGTYPWGEYDGRVSAIFDGNVETGWHTELAAQPPHCIAVDMQTPQRVTAIELQHLREAMTDDEHNWIYISHVRVYLRNDEPYNPHVGDIANYYPASQSVTEYTWDVASIPVTIKLPQPTEGRYLMLLFTDTRAAPHMSFTELNVYVE